MTLGEVLLVLVDEPAWGWTHDEPVAMQRLKQSIQAYGQLTPVLLGKRGHRYVIVEGRKRIRILRELGHLHVRAAICEDDLPDETLIGMAMAVLVRQETDYARLAHAVKDLTGGDQDAVEMLAKVTPWTAQRLQQMITLTTFDWDKYRELASEQHLFAWDAVTEESIAPDQVPLPPEPPPPPPPPEPEPEPEPELMPPVTVAPETQTKKDMQMSLW